MDVIGWMRYDVGYIGTIQQHELPDLPQEVIEALKKDRTCVVGDITYGPTKESVEQVHAEDG